MPRSLARTAALLLTTTLVLVAAGCGDDDAAEKPKAPQPAKGTYVGKVDGTNAYIALVSDGKKVDGYICDAKEISTWIAEESIVDASAKLVSRKGKALGEAKLAGEKASGELTMDGKRHAFNAELASGEAGLYRGVKGNLGKPASAESGLIVLADGSQRGATNIIFKPDQIMADPMMIMPSPMGVMADPMMIMPSPMINIAQPKVNITKLGSQNLQRVNSPSTIAGG